MAMLTIWLEKSILCSRYLAWQRARLVKALGSTQPSTI